jgi:hypothetical protein
MDESKDEDLEQYKWYVALEEEYNALKCPVY